MSDDKKINVTGMAGGQADTVIAAGVVYGGMGNRTNKEGDNYTVLGGNVGQMGQAARAERITVGGGAGNTAEESKLVEDMSDDKKFNVKGMTGGQAETVNAAYDVRGGMGNRTNREGDNYAVHGGNVGQMGQAAQAERITVGGGAGNTAEARYTANNSNIGQMGENGKATGTSFEKSKQAEVKDTASMISGEELEEETGALDGDTEDSDDLC